jgi:hypothetical protein
MAFELVKHDTTPAGLFYVGHAEQATFDVTLPPEQLPYWRAVVGEGH